MVSLLYILAIITTSAFVTSSSSPDSQLVFTQIVWRHGDRTPTHSLPIDPNPPTVWPQGYGQLTPRGMKQHYDLGQLIRRTYIEEMDADMWFGGKALDGNYTREQIYVRADDEPRTLQSAYSNLAGMFPVGSPSTTPQDMSQWPTEYSPIPVHTEKHKHDMLLNTGHHCDLGEKLQAELYDNPYLTALIMANGELLDMLSEWTGYANLSITHVGHVYGVVAIEYFWNGTSGVEVEIPQWLDYKVNLIYGSCPDNITEGIDIFHVDNSMPSCVHTNVCAFHAILKLKFACKTYEKASVELARLYGGYLLAHLSDIMQEKWKCSLKSERKHKCDDYKFDDDETELDLNALLYVAYSAHDTTIVALLRTLQNVEEVVHISMVGTPQYSSAVALELWAVRDERSRAWTPNVALRYFDGVNYVHPSFDGKNWRTVTNTISGCPNDTTSTLCPLDTFIRRNAPFMLSPNGRKYDCELTHSLSTTTTATGATPEKCDVAAIVLGVTSIVLSLVVALLSARLMMLNAT